MSSDKNAVVYARYSSHRQGEQSIEGQLAAAYKYAKENGFKIIHEYIDRATTGRNDNREQFQKMLRDTAKKQFNTIILWKIDRFGRNREEIAFNKYRCKKNGVKVVYVAESIPDSPEGVILESVLEGMAEYYSLQLAQNVKRGQRASAEKCQCTGGGRILGYCVDPETKRYVIDETTAPTVRLIFKLYSEGMTVPEVVDELNNKGIRTLRNTKFTRNSLYSLLKNEKYIGVYKYRDEIRIEGGVPAIIDKEMFMNAQKKLRENKKAPYRKWTRADYILTDKLFCGKCGAKMIGESGTGRSGQKYNYYTCANRKKEHACDKRPIQQEVIESKVIDVILNILYNDDILESIADAVWEYYKSQQTDDGTKETLELKLREIEKANANIMKAIEAGIFNDTTKKRMDELEEQRAEIKAELASIELQQAVKVTREYVLFFLTELRKGDPGNIHFQKRLIEVFVNAIFLYDDDKITITFNYSNDNKPVVLSDIDLIEKDGEVFGYHATTSTTSERTLLCSDFSMQKNQSHVPSFLLFRKRSHSRRLFGCKRPHSAFGSLPTFCGLRLWRSLISKRFTSFKIIRAYEC